ncbi:MAG: hypothetical protein ACFFFH_13055 [Candidatus Thorarchaeota archaeon]
MRMLKNIKLYILLLIYITNLTIITEINFDVIDDQINAVPRLMTTIQNDGFTEKDISSVNSNSMLSKINSQADETSTESAQLIPRAGIQSSSSEDPVDNNFSNVDSSEDKGSHSNFEDQQNGPDSAYDILTEASDSQINQMDLFVDSWDGVHDNWERYGVSPYLDVQDEPSNYVYGKNGGKGSSDGDLIGDFDFEDTSQIGIILSVKILVYGRGNPFDARRAYFSVYLWDGDKYSEIMDFYNERFWTWKEVDITAVINTWSQINEAKIYLRTEDPQARNYGQQACDAALIRVEYEKLTHEVDLEVQWTSAVYTRTNEELAICTGDLGEEDLRVDVWTGSWQTVIPSLTTNTWNNVSISSYLTSETFTIRFKGTNESNDWIQDQWEIDISLLHTWDSNHAPIAANLTLSPDPLLSNQTLSLSYDFFDEDGDDEDGTEIRWYKNSVLQPAHNDYTQIPSFELDKNDAWYATVRPKDGQLFGNISTSESITVKNTPPTVDNVFVSPSEPKTNFDLQTTYQWDDIDSGDLETGSKIYWFLNRTDSFILQGDYNDSTTIPANATLKGDWWYYSVIPSDGEDYGISRSSSIVTIENTIPTLLNLTINDYNESATVLDNVDLKANYTYLDIDNQENPSIDNPDLASREIRWYQNGMLRPDLNDTLLVQSGNTTTTHWWQFKIRIKDDNDYSEWIWSPSVWIGVAPNNLPKAENLTLNLSNPVHDGFLYIDYDYYDEDGDEESVSLYQWFKNDVHQSQFDGIRNLTTAVLIKGDIWYAKVRPRDLYDYGEWNVSSIIIIQNSAPYVTSAEIFPTVNVYTSNILVANFEGDDVDVSDQIIGYDIIWYMNSVPVPTLSNNTEVEANYTSKGQYWIYQVQVFDGQAWSDLVSPVVGIFIQNSKPYVENITLIGGHNTSEDITVNYDFVDIDGDLESEETEIKWMIFHKGNIVPNPPHTQTLPSSWIAAGDYVFCWIQPSDGEAFGTITDSTSFPNGYLLVGNSAPELISEPIILDSNGEMNFIVTALFLHVNYSALDIDQDEGSQVYGIEQIEGLVEGTNIVVGSDYKWYRNGNLVPELTNPYIDSSYLNKGDTWLVSVRPKDLAGAAGNWVNSSIIIISNTPPIILGSEFIFNNKTSDIFPVDRIDEFYVEDENITIAYEFIDYDNDSDNSKIQWFRKITNGSWEELSEFENITVILSSNLSPGETWFCQITSFDGFTRGNQINSSEITIESRPVIHSYVVKPDETEEGRYELTINVTNHQYPISRVEFEVCCPDNTTQSYLGIQVENAESNWTIQCDILNYLDEEIIVNVKVITQIPDTDFEIFSFISFNFTVEDIVPPQVLEVDIKINEQNPANLTFYAKIQEGGSGIAKVMLLYSIEKEANNGGFGSRIVQSEATMSFINATGDVALYFVSIDFSPLKNGKINYWIQTVDQMGNTHEGYAYTSDTRVDLPRDITGDILIASGVVIVITVLLIVFISVVRTKRKRKVYTKAKIAIEIGEKASDIFSLRAIICKNKYGLPLYTQNLGGQDQDGDLIAGLSTAMTDFVSQIAQRSIGSGEFDVLEREGFTILSYHGEFIIISVVSVEKLSSFMKSQLIAISNKVEHEIPIEELDSGVLTSNESIIQKIFYEFLPLGLLHPLTADYEVIKKRKKKLNKSERKWLKSLRRIPSFMEGEHVFYATTFISAYTAKGTSFIKAFNFLEHCFDLEILKPYTENEMNSY